MIYCIVYVRLKDGSKGILNRLAGPLHLSPLVKREAYLIRDRWRLSIEPNAQVEVSFR